MENGKTSISFFNKKTIVTFFLSILVVMIHINAFGLYEINKTLPSGKILDTIKVILESSVTSVAIRLFFLISGVLFYRNYTYKDTVKKYKSRMKSLLIPYLIWCSLYTAMVMVLHYTPLGARFQFDVPFSVKNLIMGVLFNDFYSSFWFIFNLMIFTLACPLIYSILKNKWVGLGALVALIVLYGFGIKIPEMITINGAEYVAFWRADSIILYMIGAYIGIHAFDWFSKAKSKKFSIVSLVVSALMVALQFVNSIVAVPAIFNLISLIIFSLSLWFAFDLLKFEKKPSSIFNYSFMMFALNFYMGLLVPQVVYYLLPKTPFFALVNFILSGVIEVAIIIVIAYALDKKAHKVYALITGGR